MRTKTFLEFFSGGGMARAGLGAGWRCLFANDFDAAKGRAYLANWGEGAFRLGDIHALGAGDVPGADAGPDPSPLPARGERVRVRGRSVEANVRRNGAVEAEAPSSPCDQPLTPALSPRAGRGGAAAPARINDVPPDLAWASFPCQDLSLAGNGAGLAGARSSAFFGFRDIIAALAREHRAPKILALENVTGLITSNDGRDFSALLRALKELGYVFGALTIDAALFSPQSRPRLFIVALREDMAVSREVCALAPTPLFASAALLRAHENLDADLKPRWRWWRLPAPPAMNARLVDVIENDPPDAPFHAPEQTRRLIDLMTAPHREKLREAVASGAKKVGALYRRTRVVDGVKRQCAEVRFDGVAGCLRTPGGGSSRQFIVIVEGERVRTRLISGREAARLMGLAEDYILPKRYSETLHLLGDGVSVPVVRFLAEHLFAPLVEARALAAAE